MDDRDRWWERIKEIFAFGMQMIDGDEDDDSGLNEVNKFLCKLAEVHIYTG